MAAMNQQISKILKCVRSSNLHFAIQETPFSVYITVRKKLISGDIKMEVDEVETKNHILKVYLSEMNQKCEDLVKDNEVLKNLLDEKESEYQACESLAHELGIKLDEAKVEVSEAVKKGSRFVIENEEHLTSLNNFIANNKDIKDDLNRTRVAHDNLVKELKQINKASTAKDKELFRLTNKIKNLETSLKNQKQENKDLMIEKNKATKENLKAQKQIVKLKERKPSVSKSTTTIPVYFSEASTSTISPLASDASSNTSPVHRCSQISQTSHHSDIPYRI